MTAEIVDDDDVAGLEQWQQDMLDIGAKAFAVDRAVEQAGRSETVATQRAKEGQRAPAPVRGEAAYPLVLVIPPSQGRHVGFDPGLVDEDQAARVKPGHDHQRRHLRATSARPCSRANSFFLTVGPHGA